MTTNPLAREKLSKSEKKLSGIIYERGVDDKGFAIIRSQGDKAGLQGIISFCNPVSFSWKMTYSNEKSGNFEANNKKSAVLYSFIKTVN